MDATDRALAMVALWTTVFLIYGWPRVEVASRTPHAKGYMTM
jgi:hypothetical protein